MENGVWNQREWSVDAPPSWRCPHCRHGVLCLEADTLKFAPTAQSPFITDYELPTLAGYEARFVCMFYCSDRDCADPASVAGTVRRKRTSYSDDDESHQCVEMFAPTHIDPPPEMIDLPEAAPQKMADEIRCAFAQYWRSSSACATNIRRSIEFLLDHKGIPRAEERSSHHLTLDARLRKFKETQPDLAEKLLALKLLGNSGAHSSNVPHEDLVKAFDILEHVLEELFDRRSALIQNHADDLKAKYGNR